MVADFDEQGRGVFVIDVEVVMVDIDRLVPFELEPSVHLFPNLRKLLAMSSFRSSCLTGESVCLPVPPASSRPRGISPTPVPAPLEMEPSCPTGCELTSTTRVRFPACRYRR